MPASSELLAAATQSSSTPWTPSDWTAIAALVLSVANSIWAFLSGYWRKRAASFEVRWELVTYPNGHGGQATDGRIAIANHGSGKAKDITLRARHEGGVASGNLEKLAPGPTGLDRPIPVIHPGQTWYVSHTSTMGGGMLTSVEVSWNDLRPRRQTLEVYVSQSRIV